jgi:hypothetical protein
VDGTTADVRWFPGSEVTGDSEQMVGLVAWALTAQRRQALAGWRGGSTRSSLG